MKTRIVDKRHDLQGQRSSPRCHMVHLRVLSHKSRIQSLRNTEISRKIAHPADNIVDQFQSQKVKCQGHQAD